MKHTNHVPHNLPRIHPATDSIKPAQAKTTRLFFNQIIDQEKKETMTTADQITKMLADMEQVPFEQRENLSKLIGKYKSEMWQAGYTKGIEVATATPPYTVIATAGTYEQLTEKAA